MSSLVRRLTIRAMKDAGMERLKPAPGHKLGMIVDNNGERVGIHYPGAIPRKYVPDGPKGT